MRQRGTIRGWKDDKGFGFVTPLAGGEDAFVHINAFLNRQRRPVDGDEISYEAVQDFQQRWQAKAIRYADEVPAATAAPVQETRTFAANHKAGASALPVLRILLGLLVMAVLALAAMYVSGVRSPQALPLLAPTPPPAAQVRAQISAQDRASLESGRTSPRAAQQVPAMETGIGQRSCDGRTRCGQMTSCEEANWFVSHCPDTKMDGDGDGVACEQQWCGGEG